MTYLSQSGTCTYGGCCSASAGNSGYSSRGMGGSGIAGYSGDGIESAISAYSGSGISNLETAVQYSPFQSLPMMIGTAAGTSGSAGLQKYAKGFGYALKGLTGNAYSPLYAKNQSQSQPFSPELFLRQGRPAAQFIGKIEDIKEYIEKAFIATTGHELQKDIIFRVLAKEEFKNTHEHFGGIWSEGIQGFSINRKGFSQSLVFLRESDLDRMLVTAGHEIGHVLSFPLTQQLNEEAKAFAFEMEWIHALYINDIAGLQQSINLTPNPAKNGLHDTAFAFVKSILDKGKAALDIFRELVSGALAVTEGDIHGS